MIAYYARRTILVIGILISLGLFGLMSRWLGVPAHLKYNTLLLDEPTPLKAILGVATALCLSTVVASLVVGRLRHDAGLLCAGFGLAALGWSGGSIQHAYREHPQASIFLTMAIETVILYAMIAGAWSLLRIGKAKGMLSDRLELAIVKDEPFDQKLLATATHAAVMGVLLVLLLRSDDKLQALLSIGAASYVGALVAHKFVPTQPSTWFWGAPGLLALVAYLFSYFLGDPKYLSIGQPLGFFAPLVRAAPIDYASAGTIGALLGYWTRQQAHALTGAESAETVAS